VTSPPAVSESLAIYFKAKDYDSDDDNDGESCRAAGSREKERKQKFFSDDVIRDLIQGYLTELSKTVGVYMDSASGEERQVDGESIPLELFPGKSFETKCNEDSSAVQEDLTCPITLHIMQDPVKCSDGKTYERAAIEKQFLQNRTSPWTSAPLEPDGCDSSKPRCTPENRMPRVKKRTRSGAAATEPRKELSLEKSSERGTARHVISILRRSSLNSSQIRPMRSVHA